MTPLPASILPIASSASAPPFAMALSIAGLPRAKNELVKEYPAKFSGVLTKGKYVAVILPNTGTLFILATLEAILLSFVKVILAASSRAAFSSCAGVLFIILLTNSPCALVPGVNPF